MKGPEIAMDFSSMLTTFMKALTEDPRFRLITKEIAMADNRTARHQDFPGDWELENFESRGPTGVTYPFGKRATGILHYSSQGHMSVQIMREQPEIAAGQVVKINDEPLFEEEPFTSELTPLVQVFEGYLAYFGQYRLDLSGGTVSHIVAGSNRPNFVNRRLVRAFEMEGDLLRLKPPSPDQVATTLTWRRVKDR